MNTSVLQNIKNAANKKKINILIIKTSSLGDIIHTFPALTDAKNNIPAITFDWVTEEAFAEIPTWHQAINKVIPVAWRRWRNNLGNATSLREIWYFLKILRQKKYDLIIDAQGLIKSAILAKIAKGKSYGYDKKSAREFCASFLYQKKFSVSKDQHAINRIRQLFSQILGYNISKEPNYGINKKLFTAQNNKNCHDRYIIFLHGTSREKKCWNEKKWHDLGQFAATSGFDIYLPWINNLELARAKRIAQNNPHVKILPKTNLSTLATLLNSAKCVISVDTGLGHVAAACGTPNVSLYGPTNPKLSGTVGSNQIHLLNFDQIEAADVWQKIKEDFDL